MEIKTDGIVLRVQATGESDRIVTVLTRSHGVIRAFARGARRLKNKLHSSTVLLCYGNFNIFYNSAKDTYHINEAEAVELFFDLREDIGTLALSHYFCELASVLSPIGSNSDEELRLILNSLYMLANKKRHPFMLKAIMELRLMSISGYMPNLVACYTCGCYESEPMLFDIRGCRIFCSECFPAQYSVPLPLTVISAMRHIIYSDLEKLFLFSLENSEYAMLSEITEKYIDAFIRHKFLSLDFYKSL